MRLSVVMGVVLVVAMMAGGCVSTSKYTEAVAEAEAAKTDLETTRARKNALEQQVKTLKDLNLKLASEAQSAKDELQRIEYGRDKERASIEGRTKELEQKIKDLTAQHRSLRNDYEEVKRHNETLKSLVSRYQKELKDQRVVAPPSPRPSAVSPSPPSAGGVAPTSVPGAQAKLPSDRDSGVPPMPAPPPPKSSLAQLNVNTASANDMVLFLGLTKEAADRVVANRPYRIKGELVAKNALPKETFDLIKDKITVAP
ncbi:MAG: hypothetical protein E6K63_02080 [Nitrospirae bacterium]|nr:MAG: hypothetical protein E6K63_02080 [Nitrospirota bacterium]